MDTSERDLILKAIKIISTAGVSPTRQALLEFITKQGANEQTLDILEELIESGDITCQVAIML